MRVSAVMETHHCRSASESGCGPGVAVVPSWCFMLHSNSPAMADALHPIMHARRTFPDGVASHPEDSRCSTSHARLYRRLCRTC